MEISGSPETTPAERIPPDRPFQSSGHFPRMYIVAAVVCALAATATTVWVLRKEHAKQLNYWNERLTRVADTNTLLFNLWIQQRNRDAQTVASFPAVKASLSGPADKKAADQARTHASVVLDLVRDPDTYSALYVLDGKGKVAAGSSGAPPLDPEILQDFRRFTNVGMLTLFAEGNDTGFPQLAVIAPVWQTDRASERNPAHDEIAGA